eukprot:TRINITY_DN66810_c0_g1_i1.p1 TRINITY_DN66810_c0_g1~~TRINITY_DN66810_c0_g1_i1.p1  ORF type:complete len:618 (-),score=88.75 TRINITY_DN66810_c0_g1_i1:8-1861(-)
MSNDQAKLDALSLLGWLTCTALAPNERVQTLANEMLSVAVRSPETATYKPAFTILETLLSSPVEKVLQHFLDQQLNRYHEKFSGPVLTDLQQRFSWLADTLQSFSDLFPPNWPILEELAIVFCKQLEFEIQSELQQLETTFHALTESGSHNLQVKDLFVAWRTARSNERDLAKKFVNTTDGRILPFLGVVSGCFERSTVIPLFAEHALRTTVTKILQCETWQGLPSQILESADSLFLFIKNQFDACTSVSAGNVLTMVHFAWRKHLVSYAVHLLSCLPGVWCAPVELATPQKICLIANSADCWCGLIDSLTEGIQIHISSAFVAGINLEIAKEAFAFVATKALDCLVSGFLSKAKPALVMLCKEEWSRPLLGKECFYCQRLEADFLDFGSTICPIVENLHCGVWALCRGIVVALTAKVLRSLCTLKGMHPDNTERLLDDALQLSSFLQHDLPKSLHGTKRQSELTTQAAVDYQHFTEAELASLQHFLAVLQAPLPLAVEQYATLIPDPSVDQFRRILVLRGVKDDVALPYIQRLKTKLTAGLAPAIRTPSPVSSGRSSDGAIFATTGIYTAEMLSGRFRIRWPSLDGSGLLSTLTFEKEVVFRQVWRFIVESDAESA